MGRCKDCSIDARWSITVVNTGVVVKDLTLEDKDKDKDLMSKGKDKDEDSKIGSRGSLKTRAFLKNTSQGPHTTPIGGR